MSLAKHAISQEDALAAVIASIAREEEAIANLLDAESEKIRFAIERLRDCHEDASLLLALNESVDSVVAQLVDMQIVLKNKLRLALGHLPKPPEPPVPPPPPPKPPCCAVFSACSRYCWTGGRTLNLQLDAGTAHNNTCCLKAARRNCNSYIVLPAGRLFSAEIDIVLSNPSRRAIAIEVKQEARGATLFAKTYHFEAGTHKIKIDDTIDLKCEKRHESLLSFRLLSAQSLEIKRAVVKIEEVRQWQ